MPYSKPMTIDPRDVDRVCQAIKFEGQFLAQPDYLVYSAYQGRVMATGETCFGVTLPRTRAVRNEFFRQVFLLLGEAVANRLVSTWRMDPLGLEIVLYFPGVSLASRLPCYAQEAV